MNAQRLRCPFSKTNNTNNKVVETYMSHICRPIHIYTSKKAFKGLYFSEDVFSQSDMFLKGHYQSIFTGFSRGFC